MQLYRGFTEGVSNNLIENEYLETPRLPKNLHVHIHEVADNWFQKKFGIRARSQTIFCTPDKDQAEEYGKAYKVTVPQSLDYKLIFSIDVRDLIAIEGDICDVYCDEEIIDWLEDKSYEVVTNFLDLPIGFCGEVMLYCKQYEVSGVK
jgi:hypothetical protein